MIQIRTKGRITRRGVNHAHVRVEVEAKLALARGISAAVDLLSHGSKLEGHFCMHEDTTFTINNPPPHHTYLSLSLRHPGTNALRPAIQSPSSMIETNTIHLSLHLNPNHTPRHSLTPSVSLHHPILPPAQHIPPHLHLHLHPHLAVFARPTPLLCIVNHAAPSHAPLSHDAHR